MSTQSVSMAIDSALRLVRKGPPGRAWANSRTNATQRERRRDSPLCRLFYRHNGGVNRIGVDNSELISEELDATIR